MAGSGIGAVVSGLRLRRTPTRVSRRTGPPRHRPVSAAQGSARAPGAPALTPAQVAALGGAKAGGIQEPSVKGQLTLTDFTGNPESKKLTIEFYDQNGSLALSDVVSVNTDGTYSYYSSLSGTYDVRLKATSFLAKRVTGVTLQASAATVDATLINGDVDDDNAVTVFDYGILSDAFDSTPESANWNPAADLDGDLSVTVFDYGILSNNFDLSGDN